MSAFPSLDHTFTTTDWFVIATHILERPATTSKSLSQNERLEKLFDSTNFNDAPHSPRIVGWDFLTILNMERGNETGHGGMCTRGKDKHELDALSQADGNETAGKSVGRRCDL